mgnify:CR=1 FL=1
MRKEMQTLLDDIELDIQELKYLMQVLATDANPTLKVVAKRNIQQMRARLDALQKLLDETPVEEVAIPEAPVAPVAIPEPAAAPEPVTFVQLRSRLAEISRDGHTNEVKLLITKYGSNKLSDVPENKYAELLAEAEKL